MYLFIFKNGENGAAFIVYDKKNLAVTVMTSFKHTEVQMREYGSLSLSIRSED